MRAGYHRLGGYLLGVCGALAPGLASAGDCPTYPEDPYTVVSGWPSNKDPATADGWQTTTVSAGQTRCGVTLNFTPGSTNASGLTYGAAIAELDSSQITGGNWVVDATCAGAVNSSVYAVWRVYRNMTACLPGGCTRGARAYVTVIDADCDVPVPSTEDCSDWAGRDAQGFAEGKPADWVPPETSCLPVPGVGNCDSYRRGQLNGGTTRCVPGTSLGCVPVPFSRNGDSFMWRNTFTGLDCELPEPEVEEIVVEGEACNGEFCEGVNARPGCGFLNGDYVCTDEMEPDECFRDSDGSMTCVEGTPTPPVPDNGTPGVPADPDASTDRCQGGDDCETIDNYEPETVDGSNRPVPNGPNADGSGPVGPGTGGSTVGSGSGSGGGDGDGEGTGTGGTASGGVTCEAPPECEDDPVQCAVLAQAWRIRCPDLEELGDLTEQFGPIGTGGSGTDLLGSDTGVDVPEAFDVAGFLGAGGGEACLDDIELDLDDLGTYEIPVSTWCTWMNLIGVLVMVGAYIGGIKIVIGGI